MDYLSALNEKQLEAVTATEGYLRVIAGAGSGKTKLLVSRYAYLVKEYGINSANILCVTFTNKAAGEMKRRIRSLIGQGLGRRRCAARRADFADAERLHIVGNAGGGGCESHAQATCQHARCASKADDLQRQPAGAVCIAFLQTKPFARSTRPGRQGGDSLFSIVERVCCLKGDMLF